jgi:hypothetical protein
MQPEKIGTLINDSKNAPQTRGTYNTTFKPDIGTPGEEEGE